MVTPRKTKTAVKAKSESANDKKRAKTRSIKSYFGAPEKATQSAGQPIRSKIEQRAYDLYLRRGCSDGLEGFDWDVAETFVKLENASSKASGSKNRIQANSKDLEADIQKKAYELYEKRGYSHGHNEFDWNLARDIVYLQKKIKP